MFVFLLIISCVGGKDCPVSSGTPVAFLYSEGADTCVSTYAVNGLGTTDVVDIYFGETLIGDLAADDNGSLLAAVGNIYGQEGILALVVPWHDEDWCRSLVGENWFVYANGATTATVEIPFDEDCISEGFVDWD